MSLLLARRYEWIKCVQIMVPTLKEFTTSEESQRCVQLTVNTAECDQDTGAQRTQRHGEVTGHETGQWGPYWTMGSFPEGRGESISVKEQHDYRYADSACRFTGRPLGREQSCLAWKGKSIRRWPGALELEKPGNMSYIDMSVSVSSGSWCPRTKLSLNWEES